MWNHMLKLNHLKARSLLERASLSNVREAYVEAKSQGYKAFAKRASLLDVWKLVLRLNHMEVRLLLKRRVCRTS